MNCEVIPPQLPASSAKRIVPVKSVSSIAGYEWIKESVLRKWIYYADTPKITAKGDAIPCNKMHQFGVIIRMNRRIWIDLDALDAFIEDMRVVHSA